MKTLAGAKGADLDRFRDRHATFKQAALKWVLANPQVSNLVISISSRRQVDEYAAASGAPMSEGEQAALAEYAALFSTEICRFCNACEAACPDEVRIADVLRFAMYFHEYGQEERGRESYARLVAAERGVHCAHCAGHCEAACGYDLPVKTPCCAQKTLGLKRPSKSGARDGERLRSDSMTASLPALSLLPLAIFVSTYGVEVGFRGHLRVGLPVTVLSLVFAALAMALW
jgi:ferredoxin